MVLKDTLKRFPLLKVLQGIFFVVVSAGTLYNAYFISEHSRKIYKPVIGVFDVKTFRVLIDNDGSNNYENVKGAVLDLIFKNTGNLPAKNVKVLSKLKIGNTTLPFTERELSEGFVLLQGGTASNRATISKQTLDKMLDGEQLILSVDMHYTDWEEEILTTYTSSYEVQIRSKNPLDLAVNNH